jgi:hypothetical protein
MRSSYPHIQILKLDDHTLSAVRDRLLRLLHAQNDDVPCSSDTGPTIEIMPNLFRDTADNEYQFGTKK